MSALPPKADKRAHVSVCPLCANSVINAVQQTVFTAFHPDEISHSSARILSRLVKAVEDMGPALWPERQHGHDEYDKQ
jgi:hypothetical protein